MNNAFNGYAVFFFPQALEALGPAIQPYLLESPAGPHVLCREIDTGGSLIELTMDGKTTEGDRIDLELMLPSSMVRMIVSARTDQAFGFGPRVPVEPIAADPPVVAAAEGPALAPGADASAPAAPARRSMPSPAGRAAGKANASRKRAAPAKKSAAGDKAKAKPAAGKAAKPPAKPAAKPARVAKAARAGKAAAGAKPVRKAQGNRARK